MPNPLGLVTLAVDFDGTLVEDDGRGGLAWRRGAREFLFGAVEAGIVIWIHTCRAQATTGYEEQLGDADEFYRSGRVPDDVLYGWRLRQEMEDFLRAEGVRDLVRVWEGPGKPLADMYPDDKGERPDWLVLAAELGVRLDRAIPGRPTQVGGGPAGPAPANSTPLAPVGAGTGGSTAPPPGAGAADDAAGAPAGVLLGPTP